MRCRAAHLGLCPVQRPKVRPAGIGDRLLPGLAVRSAHLHLGLAPGGVALWLAAVVSLSFLIRPLLELSLRPGPGLWGPGTPLVCPAPCTVACPEGHCSAGPGRWLVLPPLLPVVTIPTVPSGAARLPRESRGGSCRQESHLRPDGPHTRVRKRTGWGARRPQGLRPGLRGGSRGGLGGQRPAQPHPTRGPPCAALARCPSSAASRGSYTRKAFLLLHGPHQVSSPRVVSERA